MEDYLKERKEEIRNDEVVDNFVRVFMMVCGKSSAGELVSEKIVRAYIKNYMLASCIEIDQKFMEFDFGVDFESKDPNCQFKHNALSFTMDGTKRSKLVGIDAIYIPQTWRLSASHDMEDMPVAPMPSVLTQDLDELFNMSMNAMAQKLVNTISLYRMQVKKKVDLPFARLLTGAGSKSEKSQRRRGKSTDLTIYEPDRPIYKKDEFDGKMFERYYRSILMLQYYIKFF